MILIDTTFFGHNEAANRKLSLSTSIFTADLLDAFSKLGYSDKFTLLVYYNHLDYFNEKFPEYKKIAVRWWPVSLLYKLTGKTANKFIKKSGAYKRIIEKSGCDSIWFPYAMSNTFIKTKLNAYATVHDIYRIHHGTTKEAIAFRNFITDTATKLISISDYTRKDMVQTTGCKKEIPIIPNSIVFDTGKETPVEGLGEKFILDINAYNSKKNTLTLIKAFDFIKDKIESNLVLCGGYKEPEYFSQIESYINEKGLSDRVKILYRVTDEERNWLLNHSFIFVTPSLFEGFGRTPVEAAVCKVPVISTKETSLYEATMGLCNYVENPTDEKELGELILKVRDNYPAKEKLEEISSRLKNEYLAENCAKKYLKIFGITKE